MRRRGFGRLTFAMRSRCGRCGGEHGDTAIECGVVNLNQKASAAIFRRG
jgi:hypothetical protein